MVGLMEDEDIILLIIGDENVPEGDDQEVEMLWPLSTKHKTLESEDKPAFDEILDTVAKHGEYISIKLEYEHNTYLEEELSKNSVKEAIEKIKYEIESNSDYSRDTLGGNGFNVKLPRKRTMLTEGQCEPYVQQLRKEYPDMKQDPKLLIKHLTSIMKNIKPPTPPSNFCRVNHHGLFVCCTCEAESESVNFAARHYQEKHGERYLECFACGSEFRGTTGLYKHEKQCIAPDARIVLQARGRFLGRKGRSRPFLTMNKFSLNRSPNRMERKPAKLYCAKCPASFSNRPTLEAHENSHEGLRPYSCDACSANFTSERGLKRHLPVHSKSQYICDHCGRMFKLWPALVSHLDTHRPLPKYGCDRCERRFAQKRSFLRHLNNGHLDLPAAHRCPLCPESYTRKSRLATHMMGAHGSTVTAEEKFQDVSTLTNTNIIEATIAFDSETDKLDVLQNSFPVEFQQIPEYTNQVVPEPVIESLLALQPINSQPYSQEQIVYEIVLDKEENTEMMNDFFECTPTNFRPGMYSIENGVFTKLISESEY